MAYVEECISESESRKFEEGLNTNVKLDILPICIIAIIIRSLTDDNGYDANWQLFI